MQAKRIRVTEESGGAVGSSTRADLAIPTEPREMANVHNIWLGISATPTTAGSNAEGVWSLFTIPDPLTPPILTAALLDGELHNRRIIACGVWHASNEMPFNMPPTQVKTSRNMNAGDRMILESTISVISSGTVSQSISLCAHVVRK